MLTLLDGFGFTLFMEPTFDALNQLNAVLYPPL
ncbi:Uncharacterised protein [Vibrio cholerae]|nr:Uncharacterised protein [Vibrio cholerae]CSC16845.1 Uncharacterised protein [Vibrio cholerae]